MPTRDGDGACSRPAWPGRPAARQHPQRRPQTARRPKRETGGGTRREWRKSKAPSPRLPAERAATCAKRVCCGGMAGQEFDVVGELCQPQRRGTGGRWIRKGTGRCPAHPRRAVRKAPACCRAAGRGPAGGQRQPGGRTRLHPSGEGAGGGAGVGRQRCAARLAGRQDAQDQSSPPRTTPRVEAARATVEEVTAATESPAVRTMDKSGSTTNHGAGRQQRHRAMRTWECSSRKTRSPASEANSARRRWRACRGESPRRRATACRGLRSTRRPGR